MIEVTLNEVRDNTEFRINSEDAEPTEPTTGTWYCAMDWNDDLEQFTGGTLAEYVGNGEFYDGDCELTYEMGCAMYLQQQ
jgi:hypothetical protein